jgi:truncated hemoglobin YjbI
MNELTPDLAAKLIGADLRNLVKKVSDGQPLTQAEREMMERTVIDGTLPQELQEARLAALARAYVLGKPLTKSQAAELSAVLPVGKPIAKRLTRQSYRYKLSHYVPILGIDKDMHGRPAKDPERKIKRWIEKGRQQVPPDLPPLDAPAQMAEWWRRNMEWRVPEYLARLETSNQASEAPGGATYPPPVAGAAASEPASHEVKQPALNGEKLEAPMMFDDATEMTADIGLNQIRSLVSTLYKRMQSAFEAGRITEGQSYMRQWKEAVAMLRQWEKDIVKIQEGKGEVLRTRVINTELGRIFNVISQSFFNALMGVLDAHAPEIPASERRQLALHHRDKCFAHLKSGRFSAIYHPGHE